MNRRIERLPVALPEPVRFRQRLEGLASVAVLAACGVLGTLLPAPRAQAQPAGSILPPGAVPVLSRVVTPNTTVGAPVGIANGGNRVTIQQNERRAILEWQKFNIGSASEVRFVQPDVGSIALNRVIDPSGDPSIIQGRLSANGQVILMNRNGVLFDRGSQVDVFALTAAAMNGPTNTQSFYDRFLGTGLLLPRASAEWSFEGVIPLAGGALPSIEVGSYGPTDAAAPRLSAATGGSIMLFAPRVLNQPGSLISAPDGQVILAAGSRIRLSENLDNAGEASVSMRGLLVEVGADAGPINVTSLVHNRGQITAERGNVTLAALAVRHDGVIETTSAVTQNGSIWLRGRKETTLGTGSVTRAPLDVANTSRLAEGDDFTPYRPQVLVEGQRIQIQGEITAPGGTVTVTARPDLVDPSGTTRIQVEDGARISVAGAWVDAPVSYNYVTQRITSNELKDSPLQRGGILFGETVTVDLRRGPVFPLFDLTAVARNQPRSVVEKATPGGSVLFDALVGDVVLSRGSIVDVSGGGFRFSAAPVSSTRIASNGVWYSIETAPNTLVYDQIGTAWRTEGGRWGISAPIGQPGAAVMEPATIEGRSAGTVTVLGGAGYASGVVLDGELRGGVTIGPGQRSAASRPAGGTLVVGGVVDVAAVNKDYRVQGARFERDPAATAVAFADALPAARIQTLLLPDSLFGSASIGSFGEYVRTGLSNLQLFVNGAIDVPAGVSLAAPPGGSILFSAARTTIDGSLSAPGGSLSLLGNAQTSAQATRRSVVLGANAVLDVAGSWINDAQSVRETGVVAALPLTRDGGTVTIGPATGSPAGELHDVTLSEGSRILVGGGGSVTSGRRITAGNGGQLTVNLNAPTFDESLVFRGAIDGLSAGSGSRLNLTAPSIRIGGAPVAVGRELVLDPGFFDLGGFTTFNLNGLAGNRVVAGTDVTPTAQSLVFLADAADRSSGSVRAAFSSTITRAEGERRPTSLTLNASRADGAGVDIDPGARIAVDPTATVALASGASITIDGEVSAPGGTITATLNRSAAQPRAAIVLGDDARLLAPGYFQQARTSNGLVQGSVLQGGQVSLQATSGSIQASPTALIDVSGASAMIDVDRTAAFASLVPGAVPVVTSRRERLDGSAGSILLRSTDSSTLPVLVGRAGGPTAAGGNLDVETAARGDSTPGVIEPLHRIVVGTAAPAQAGTETVRVDPQAIAAGGIDRVRLSSLDLIEFRGSPVIEAGRGITLDAPRFVSDTGTTRLRSNGAVTLSSPATLSLFSTQAGTGRLEVDAGRIDLAGVATYNGFGTLRLGALTDLRLIGQPVAGSNGPSAYVGSVLTTANIEIEANQVYPTTRTDFTFGVRDVVATIDPGTQAVTTTFDTRPGGQVDIRGRAGTPTTVLSAGGSVTFDADDIDSTGVVRAPLGTIAYGRVRADGSLAASRVSLGAGSVSSTQLDTALVPFGGTINGRIDWVYNGASVAGSPGREVAVRARGVELAAGARIDLSGGGDLLAIEFQPGIGGSTDILRNASVYAVLPNTLLPFAPVDPHFAALRPLGFGTGRSVYDSVYLSGTEGLPAGTYTLLPGYYALMPGAYLVVAQTGTAFQNFEPGLTGTLPDGSRVVAGYRAAYGSAARDAGWSAFAVRPGSSVSREAEYLTSNAAYFTQRAATQDLPAPRTPADAGRLELFAQTSLVVEGSISAATGAANARSARVDIAARDIAVVGAVGQPGIAPGFLQLDADPLSAFGASLLLGGVRNENGATTTLTTVADRIQVANSAASPLQGPEILLAARDSVTLEAGSVVIGRGDSSGQSTPLSIAGDGALLRAASLAPIAPPTRTGVTGATGVIDVKSGATLGADRSLLLDATRTTRFASVLDVRAGGSISLGSSRVSLGDTGALADGLVLSAAQTAAFGTLADLTLRSYSTIDLYGSPQIGASTLGRLTLDSAGLSGFPGSGAATPVSPTLSAARVTLANSAGATAAAGPAGTGTLSVDAGSIEIGAGNQRVTGFGTTVMRTTQGVAVQGTGTLAVDSDLRIESPTVATGSDALQAWTIGGTLRGTNPTAAAAGTTTPGGQLQVSATTVDLANTWRSPGGRIALEARTGDVDLRSGALLDASGRSLDIGGTPVQVPAGRVEVSSVAGDLRVQSNARIDVSAPGASGRAGSVRLEAPAAGKSVLVDGTLAGSSTGGRSGSIDIDTAVLQDFSALNARIDAGGFLESRELRVRSGDVTVAATDTVRANRVGITADNGALVVRGGIDASGPKGGDVVLSGPRLSVASGATVRAAGTSTASGATDRYSPGGEITLTSTAGTLVLEPGSTLDVSSGARGSAGRVILAAPRTANNLGVDATLAGTVRAVAGTGGSAGEVVVEGWRSYAATTLAPAGTSEAEFGTFMNGVVPNTVLGGLTLVSGSGPAVRTAVRGGVELTRAFTRDGSGAIIAGSGDLALSSPWDLTSASWIITGQPGALAVRAAGSIVLQSALGLPNDNLPSTPTWSIQLTGGADLTSADRDATASLSSLQAANTGDVRLASSAARVRTGTGRIDIDAGRDFKIEHLDAVVYTAGVPGADAVNTSRFPKDGGDISISAGRDARGTAGQWVNDWYRRGTAGASGSADGTWWPSRPSGTSPGSLATIRPRSAFRGNIGTLGGGDIELLAGRDILTLSASAPTSGRVFTDNGVRTLDVQGGGDLRIDAGGRIDGGEYLVARGQGTISAGQSIGATNPTGVLLLGESHDPASRGATVELFAGGNVTLSSASNPTILVQSSLGTPTNALPTGFQNRRSNFFTYAPETALSVLSTAGDITVSNGLVDRPSLALGGVVPVSPGDVYPPNLSLVAAQGDLVGGGPERPLRLFPAADGRLTLLAGGDITRQFFTVSDQVVGSNWPTWRSTFLTIGENPVSASAAYTALFASNLPRSVVPRSEPARLHAGGSIVDSDFTLAGPTSVFAGRDLISTPLALQNLQASDASQVIAGRDIRYLPTRGDGTPVINSGYLRIGGPGTLRVQAGRNIDLGQSQGILAIGNNANSSLPGSASAELTVMAGTTARPTPTEVTALFANLQAAGTIGSLGPSAAGTPAYDVAVAVLEAAGIAPDAQAGDRAIASLFGPSTVGGGSLSMFFSAIRTEGGSGINLVVPGGNINAGLPVAGGGNTGILTLAGGSIRSFLSGDFNVNQSKVVTLQGGDILIYTSLGNIDAGRGALSSRTTAPPRRVERRDSNGNPIPGVFDFVPPVDATGAGIRTLTSDPDGTGPLLAPRAGDVFLFAPSGFISAGEAGISSAGNIFVLGTVVNPTLITAGGSSAGVPVAAPAFSTGSLSAASASAGSQRNSEDSARTSTAAAERSVVFKPSILLVDLIGFGSRFESPESGPATQVKAVTPNPK